jgi:nicotinate-nucleotide adenylyltransferase
VKPGKIGLFGGSFDPIHNGHILPVREARKGFGLDRVIYLPTAQPPHKPGRRLAPAWSRFAMAELALLHEEGLEVSCHELTPEKPAFTVDTVQHFRRLWPEAELHLLVGGDSFRDFHLWWRWREIVEQARLIVLVRPGAELERERLPAELAALLDSGRAAVAAHRPVAVSSTGLRGQFSRGETPEAGAVPKLVIDYVRKYHLYR